MDPGLRRGDEDSERRGGDGFHRSTVRIGLNAMAIVLAVVLMLPGAAGAATAPPASSAPVAATAVVDAPPPATPVDGQPAAAATDASAPALETRDLRTFFAGLVPYMLHRNDIAGGVLAVVKDGRLIFAEGYGYADVEERTPVDAEQTLFRIGSVSKLFTWTAVMQLVAAGKIDLDADINRYLDFEIPARFGEPITMRDLMTMTPGFAETLGGMMASSPEHLASLRDYLLRRMPARIFPPGEVVAYSNYGAALAGYIVQRVSGEPFNQYVERHILQPLKMTRSTFAQPLPERLKGDLATGYITASSRQVVPFEAVQPWPAGSFTSSATDMAHFMIAHLNQGRFRGRSILPPRSVELMHSQQYTAAPGMNGYALGFFQENRNGLEIIGHAGDTVAFHSALHLLPGKDVGIFMSFNSAGQPPDGSAADMRMTLFRAFLDRYYPYTPPSRPTLDSAPEDAQRVAGWYWASRRENGGLKLLFLLGQVHVTALPNGQITISGRFMDQPNGAPKRWREVGPLTWQAVHGQSRVRFVTNPDDSIRWWVTDNFGPVQVFQPVHGLLALGTFTRLTLSAIAVWLLCLVLWIGGAIVRRRFRRRLQLSRMQARLRLAARIGVVLLLAVVFAWLQLLGWLSQPLALFHIDKLDSWLPALFTLGVFGIIGAIVIVVAALWRIARGPGGVLVRLGELLLGLSAVYAIWAIFAAGLVSFGMNF